MSSKKVDLFFFSVTNEIPKWDLGNSIKMGMDVFLFHTDLSKQLPKVSAEWLLFWDYSLGAPDIALVHQLTDTSIDVWHCGLKFGLGGMPDVINYVDPTWMYNKDASENIIHSSFRMSFRACLIRKDALSKIMPPNCYYSSLEMYGLAIGYAILKSGGVIRFHPKLVNSRSVVQSPTLPLSDEILFAKSFYPLKWQYWVLFNKQGIGKNCINWLRLPRNKQVLKPTIHSSKKAMAAVRPTTVSVLAPTLNRYTYLINELDQLAEQTVLPFEVLVTDQTDASDRVELDFGKYKNLNIRYFAQEEKGQCIAWNKLLEEAKGEYVLFLGDDADDIKPDFIEQLLLTMQKFDADIVASNVIESGIVYKDINHHYYMSDTFPITLIKRSMLLKSGFMDMFFNKNIRADHDLAMRCHLNGALMIFDSSATIFHHRAPVGGLRTHKARVVTNYMAKQSLTKFINPTSSEIYLVKKYYTPLQYKNYIRIKYFNQLITSGNLLKRLIRPLVFLFKLPSLKSTYQQNVDAANRALLKKKLSDSNI